MKLKANQLISMLFACLMLTLGAGHSYAQDSDEDDSSVYKDAFYWNNLLGRGVNLDNALVVKDGEIRALAENQLELIASAGFQSVRLPARWSNYTSNEEPYTIQESYFKRVDQLIEEALAHKLIPIIDIHQYSELMKSPTTEEARFLAMWKQISERYADYSSKLYFELLNEPSNSMVGAQWNKTLTKAIKIIRKTNPKRALLVGPGGYNAISHLDALELPRTDRNIIVTLHYYSPFYFTHQGAYWVGEQAEEWLGSTWTGTEKQKASISNSFDKAQAWSLRYNRPIHIGEFGSYEKANMKSRVRWTAYVRQEAEKRNFSWAYWEFCYGYGIYDRANKEWHSELVGALML